MKGIPLLLLFAYPALAYNTREEMVLGCRQGIMEMSRKEKLLIFAPIEGNDLAEELVDEPAKMIRRPQEMERAQLMTGSARSIPWSDSYWPIYRGGLGQRYSDPDFSGYDWKESFRYTRARTPADLIREGKTDQLSPSEKYDHLLGFTNYPLTASQWSDGEKYYQRNGSVESWMGYCHGWAAASTMMPEPKRKVKVAGMTLYPSDIKALATLLWARGNFSTRFIGGRCNTQQPRTDRHGRPNEQNCLDNNPGTWHLVVVNQLGLSQRPFIMDASFDYQVWNHPVYGYEYTYFNPRTNMTGTFLESQEKPGSWDKRKDVRAGRTRTIVGVKMSVNYSVENEPSTEEYQHTETSSVTYEYDLELDDNGEIIGGEWRSQTHPDFLWVAEPGDFPQTAGDHLVADLHSLSREMKEAARAAALKGLPAGSIVRKLVEASVEE